MIPTCFIRAPKSPQINGICEGSVQNLSHI